MVGRRNTNKQVAFLGSILLAACAIVAAAFWALPPSREVRLIPGLMPPELRLYRVGRVLVIENESTEQARENKASHMHAVAPGFRSYGTDATVFRDAITRWSRRALLQQDMGWKAWECHSSPTHMVKVSGWFIGTMAIPLVLPLAGFVRLRWVENWRLKHNRCLDCGYSLHGLNSDRCPECGSATEGPGATECEAGR